VLGILPGIVGLIQANEVIKLVLGVGESLVGRLLIFDALSMKFKEMKLRKDPSCPICGDNPTITELIDYEQFCGIMPVEESADDMEKEIAVEQVKQMLDKKQDFKLIDVRERSEYNICKIEGATLIPLGDIEAKDMSLLNGLNPDDEIVLHCKAGVRSMKALKVLEKMGFHNLKSMRGGINEWSEKVDASVPLY
jgi:adenylyltransferase/sulfurtransferase